MNPSINSQDIIIFSFEIRVQARSVYLTCLQGSEYESSDILDSIS